MKDINFKINALGTINSIFVPDCTDEKAIKLAVSRIRDIDDCLSAFKEQSEISKINKASGKNFVKVRDDTLQIIKKSVHLSKLTKGTFDITVRPIVTLWGIWKKQNFVPSDDQIMRAKKLVCYEDIVIDEINSAVMLKHPGQAIDLGSIAKGYAADEVKRILLENDIKDAVINLGGTVIIIGAPRNVGIQHPAKPTGTPMGSIRLVNKAVVTSGSYEKFFILNNRRYHHILDPRTGRPADTNLLGVTLIGDNAMEQDALTTAIFVLGIEEGNKLLADFKVHAVYVTTDFDVLLSPELQNKFALFDRN